MAESLEVSPDNPSAQRDTDNYEIDINKSSLERLNELEAPGDFVAADT